MKYRIERETSKYNKRMKWHIIGTSEGIDVTSEWKATEREAKQAVEISEWQAEHRKGNVSQ